MVTWSSNPRRLVQDSPKSYLWSTVAQVTDGPPAPVNASVPIAYENVGSGPLYLNLTNLAAGTYRIHVGPLGTTVDPKAYNGTPGSGGEDIVFVASGTSIINQKPLFLPPNPVGGLYSMVFVDTTTLVETVSTLMVQVLPESFSNVTLGLRRVHPPWLAIGPRSPGAKVYPQV